MSATHSSTSLPVFVDRKLNPRLFELVKKEYFDAYGYTLLYSDFEGNILYGFPLCDKFPCQSPCRESRKRVISVALQNGSACVDLCREGFALWAFPLKYESSPIGALIVTGVTLKGNANDREQKLHKAKSGLETIARKHSIPKYELNFRNSRNSSEETFSTQPLNSYFFEKLSESYREWEEKLKQAIRDGKQTSCYEILDLLFKEVRKHESLRIDLLKGFAIDIAVSIAKTISKPNSQQHILQGLIYESSNQIIQAETLLQIETILIQLIDKGFALGLRTSNSTHVELVDKVLTFIEQNTHLDLNRENVAKEMNISPSHLSHILKQKTGRTFSDFLNQYRVERASQAIINTNKSLAEIADEHGFCDQSYMTRVFKKYKGMSPADYKKSFTIS